MSNYYISIRQDGATGNGLINDPWDGSTVTRMNNFFNFIPSSSTIIFGTGVFPISGGRSTNLKAGWTISGAGSGIGQTTLRQVLSTSGADTHIYGLVSNGETDGVTLSNFCFDCNLNGQTDYSGIISVGIDVGGVGSIIKNVRVTGWGARGAGEAFPLSLGGPQNFGTPNTFYTGSSIINCLVDNPSTGDMTNGFTLILLGGGGGTFPKLIGGLISGCVVDGGNYPLSGFGIDPSRNAYTVYGTNSLCVNNVSYNCDNGYYQDTWTNELITVQNNIFNNVTFGISLNFLNSTGENSLNTGYFLNNIINLTGITIATQTNGISFGGNSDTGVSKFLQYMVASGNLIQFTDQQPHIFSPIIRGISLFGVNSGLIINNTFANFYTSTDSRRVSGYIVTGANPVAGIAFSNNGQIILSNNLVKYLNNTGSNNG